MPSKQAIFDNIELYPAVDLVQYIKDDIVTFDELCTETDGCFSRKARKEVLKLLEGSEEEDWLKAQTNNNEEGYSYYLMTYENGSHREEAREILSAIREANEIKKAEELKAAEELKEAQEKERLLNLWDSVDKDSISELQEFINTYPKDKRCREAKQLINDIQKEEFFGFDVQSLISRIYAIQTDNNVLDPDLEIYKLIARYLDQSKITLDDLLQAIKEDFNLLRATTLSKLIENGYLTYYDFKKLDIDYKFIQYLANDQEVQRFSVPEKLERINKSSTEIYFWGIPSSGKSCALGSILSVANNGTVSLSMSKDPDCQGYGYMTRLAQIFKQDGSIGTLPEGTSIYSTYEMGFDLEDNDGVLHPITCVDLAGELVRCMYKSDANEELSDDEIESLDIITKVLIDNRTENRKMHFFVVEYGAEDKKYEGLSQADYLDAALRYIERTGIFENDTDAIFLMVTKIDKAKVEDSELESTINTYIQDHYRGFYNGLTRICRDCDINDGKVEILPFSLGEVCFQDYCLFKAKPAANVVKKVLSLSQSCKQEKVQKGFNWFRR